MRNERRERGQGDDVRCGGDTCRVSKHDKGGHEQKSWTYAKKPCEDPMAALNNPPLARVQPVISVFWASFCLGAKAMR